MRRRNLSIEDIARAAGVNNSTVSRALRDSPLISADVRAHIQRLAREMGYTPNGIARSLQTQRTNTIGLVVTSIAAPFFVDVVKGVEEIARPARLSVLLSASYNDPEQEQAVIETFHQRRVDGVIIASSRISHFSMHQVMRIHVPTVLINSQADEPGELLHSVAVDDYLGARLAVDHLFQLGHRAIGYLGVSNRPLSNRRRLEGYRDALSAAGVSHQATWTVISATEDQPYTDDVSAEADVAAGQSLLQPLLAAGVTAVFCYNDLIAIGALIACREQGIAVPHELSIIGFDDVDVARYVTPPLTTIHQPKIDLGRRAMQIVLNLLNGHPVQDHILTPTLVIRNSTAAPRIAEHSA